MQISIHRQSHLQEVTLGNLTIEGTQFCCVTLEPGREGKGPIPPGRYLIKWQWSNHFQCQMPFLQDVPNFTGIMIHPGNTARDTRGCILVGTPSPVNIGPGRIFNSRATFAELSTFLRQTDEEITIVVN